ncbi:MAG: hypothetical protein QNJ67_19410 [Kiloniellales bacterium]|nr:hypothetical protein [Kiloniellales bacterium]
MSVLIAYEVQVFEHGQWQIEAIHPDRDTALMEARRIEEGVRPRETRVVEEVYDQTSGHTKSTVVYTTPVLRDDRKKTRLQSDRFRGRALREFRGK